jgi:tRNA(adenine34) deaminase
MTEDLDALLIRSIQLASQARAEGNHPFGALLAIDGVIVAEALNATISTRDLTAHAEMTLVRQLEQNGRLDELQHGLVVASCEPCPMCVGAMFWAGARRVVFGLSAQRLNQLAAAPNAVPFGFTITATEIGLAATPTMDIAGPRCETDALEPHLNFWT